MDFTNFINKNIRSILVDKNNDMYWEIEDDWYRVLAIGECCNSVWFAHCDGAESLQSSILLEFEDTGEEYDEKIDMSACFLKFKTNKGYATIEFRNETNFNYWGKYSIEKCAIPEKEKLDLKFLKDY